MEILSFTTNELISGIVFGFVVGVVCGCALMHDFEQIKKFEKHEKDKK